MAMVLNLVAATLQAEVSIPASVDAFLNTHCMDCHDASGREGGLDLSALNRDVGNEAAMAVWVRIHDRVKAGEMPPPEVSAPNATARARFVDQLAQPLTQAHTAHKGTVLRRLNGSEYERTINDLFGTNLRLKSMLPPDGRTREFDNVGASLSMSMVQLRQYIEAMDLVLETAIANTSAPPTPKQIRTSYAETSEGEKFIGKQWLKLNDGAVVFFQPWGYPTGMLRTANTNRAGWYRIKVRGYAYQSEKPITFAVGGTTFQRGLERPIFGYFAMPPGKPTTIELTAWIENRYMLEITPYGIYDENYLIKKNGIENYPGPGLAILDVELEGPIVDEFPSRGHELLFSGLNRQEIPPRNPNDRKRSNYQPKFEIVADDPVAAVSPVLERIAQRAFRRPVSSTDVAPYQTLFSVEISKGANIEEALRTAVTAIFCAPDFLYLQEPEGRLDDVQLANRLSYFLHRTLPDETLLAKAAAGQLSTPQSLREETEKLLQGDKFQRFVVDFTDAWLNLRDIEFTTPDQNLFPEYDLFLLDSMVRETRSYFTEQVEQNLPAATIVRSDFAMLNNRLADLYDIDGVEGPEIRKVSLPKNSVRGGYLSQASVLKVSANGTNTSPVVRGVWVLERIMGIHPPPPPPGVPGVEPDIRGASTLREILAKHRDVESCRSCHELIDPPGFALENFNPIGGWREQFRSLGDGEQIQLVVHGRKVRYRKGPPVDATGTFNDGREFSNFNEFRDHLVADKEALIRTLIEKLLTFATGRELGFSDRPEVERLVAVAIREQHGIRDLIHDVVQSEIFQHK